MSQDFPFFPETVEAALLELSVGVALKVVGVELGQEVVRDDWEGGNPVSGHEK